MPGKKMRWHSYWIFFSAVSPFFSSNGLRRRARGWEVKIDLSHFNFLPLQADLGIIRGLSLPIRFDYTNDEEMGLFDLKFRIPFRRSLWNKSIYLGMASSLAMNGFRKRGKKPPQEGTAAGEEEVSWIHLRLSCSLPPFATTTQYLVENQKIV